MAKLKLLNTIFSKLSSLSKNDGQIVVTRDSKSLYIDLEGERIEITDWIDIDNEESLLAILSPLINKYYYTKDTNKIWKYIGSEWICLNNNINEMMPTYTESTTLAKLISGEKLSVAFAKISKAITDLISHIGDTVKHITSTERTNLDTAYAHSQSAHAPSNAQANVIETVKVNGTAITPSSKAVDITVPTNNNQLTNGAGYITSSGTAKTISDTLPISKGGTGQTTGIKAANALINSLSTGNSTPTDNDYYVSQYVNGGTTTTTYHRRPMSALWSYIKSKLATVATSGSYNDLSNKPTIPTVGNGTITITQNGTTKGIFTTNQSGNTTIALTDNNTTYGVATSSSLGLVKSGTDITIDSSGNVSVNDDSHNHVISNVDGLQSALDGKAASSHTHNYAGSNSAGGNALTLQLSREGNDANWLPASSTTQMRELSHSSSNIPYSQWWQILANCSSDTNYGSQLAMGMTTNDLYFRNFAAGSWGEWKKIIFRDDIIPKADYATSAGNADTLDGNHASAFAAASHTHNYAGSSSAGGSANSLSYFKNTGTTDVGIDDTSANAIGYVSGTSSILNQNDGAMYKQVYSDNWVHEIYGDYRTGQIAVRGKDNGTWKAWRKILDSSNYTSYCTPTNIGAAPSSHTHDDRYYTESEINTKLNAKLNTSLKGSANGLAELDANGKVLSNQLPSFVDDVVEGYFSGGKFYKETAHTTEITGETGKIYIDLTTNKTYRWSGSAFVVISETLALGETSSTAYRGDRGKTAYDHSQSTHARTDATKVEKSSTNGNIKINGTETNVYTHPSGTNPHGTTKSDVGLGNVDNTADSAKSVKYATSAGSASSALKATGVVDYNSPVNTIQIGYGGDGISGDAIKYIAGYTVGNGSDVDAKIKDVSKDALKSWLGLGSLAYSSATIPTVPSSLPANGGNSATVNGHTVNSDVPANAKFTDTDTWRPQPDWNATSGDAAIKNKPTIPSVGNGTVTIKQAGTSKGTFTMNQTGNTTIELTDTNTTYSEATTSSAGLMSSTDKTRLNNLFKLTTYTASRNSLGALGDYTFTISHKVPTGYTTVGIVSFDVGNTQLVPIRTGWDTGSVYLQVHNGHSSAISSKFTVSVTVLYIRKVIS